MIHMEVGEPDFPTPPPICEAGARFIATGNVRYSGAAGIPPPARSDCPLLPRPLLVSMSRRNASSSPTAPQGRSCWRWASPPIPVTNG